MSQFRRVEDYHEIRFIHLKKDVVYIAETDGQGTWYLRFEGDRKLLSPGKLKILKNFEGIENSRTNVFAQIRKLKKLN